MKNLVTWKDQKYDKLKEIRGTMKGEFSIWKDSLIGNVKRTLDNREVLKILLKDQVANVKLYGTTLKVHMKSWPPPQSVCYI